MSYPQEFIVTLRDLKEDHRRLFDEHKALDRMLREILDNQATITDNQAVLREDLAGTESKLDSIGSGVGTLSSKVDALERKLDEVIALVRGIRAL